MGTGVKAAVVLCGCGRADGSEIHESVSLLVHLSRLGAKATCFAPDVPQADVVDHATNAAMDQTRRCLTESARISRGQIEPLDRLDAGAFDAVFFPGGFGAAKNLCTFARDGAGCRVLPEVERVIRAFHAAGKPIGLCCIAPVIAARVLGRAGGGPGVSLTLGDDAGVAAIVTGWGATHVVTPVTGAHTDATQRVATSPAYMYGQATPFEVFTGIGAMVESTLAMIGPGGARATGRGPIAATERAAAGAGR